MFKRGLHTPPHLLLDHTPYFITGAIRGRRPLLRDDALKRAFILMIEEAFTFYGWTLHDWVVLDEHYHLLGVSAQGADLSQLITRLHSRSAKWISQQTGCALPVWRNYWDYSPRDEEDFRVRQNYLYFNPIKHGYVQDLRDYPYSSFPQRLAESGYSGLAEQFRVFGGYRGLALDEDGF